MTNRTLTLILIAALMFFILLLVAVAPPIEIHAGHNTVNNFDYLTILTPYGGAEWTTSGRFEYFACSALPDGAYNPLSQLWYDRRVNCQQGS